jgi:hypothetical protein
LNSDAGILVDLLCHLIDLSLSLEEPMRQIAEIAGWDALEQ